MASVDAIALLATVKLSFNTHSFNYVVCQEINSLNTKYCLVVLVKM